MKQETTTFVVKGLCCSSEELLIRKKLNTMNEVEIRGINVIEKTVSLNHSCSTEAILAALNDIGMNASLPAPNTKEQTFWERNTGLMFTLISAAFLLAGMILTFLVPSNDLSKVFFTIAIVSSGWTIFLKGMKALKNFSLEMNFLMTVATIGALAIGKWEEGAVVMFLFAVAEMLERYSLQRSRNAIHSLMNLTPKTARVKRNSAILTVEIQQVRIGEHIFIHPGERIPLDGNVVSGSSTVNQAPVTGESKSVLKNIGDEVFAGSLNEQGALEINVLKPYNDTMLARIVKLVEEAQATRSPLNNLVDRFARYYTPIVFALACLVAILPPLVLGANSSEWFYRALVLLVIACPCALVLSTPVTIMSGLANAARNGVLIKGGKFLEMLGSINAIAFDKTGTLTKGKPRVTDVISLNSLTREEIIQTASLVEHRSEHHLAGAVRRIALDENLASTDSLLQHFESLTGKGVRATINNTTYVVGSHQLIEEMNICSPEVERSLEQLEKEGKSTLILATEHEPLGIIAVADELRSEAAQTVRDIRAFGVQKVILLTGDNASTAASIAMQTGIEDVEHEILPDEKLNHVAALKHKYGTVAMIGDGINDAPALAASTIGIAMGGTGSDISLEAADVVLISDDLGKLPYAMKLSKKTVQIIKQNIALALATKLVFLILGMFGMATLWMAIIADDGATLLVILNGLRALRFKPK